MPEPIEQPGQAPEAPAPKAKTRKSSGTALAKLKKKYRLDEAVAINAVGSDNRPLGRGPLLDPEVFNKFAELDDTPDKRYLDWMLYQAGGGAEAFEKAKKQWGDDTPEKTPEDFFRKFQVEAPNTRLTTQEISAYAQTSGLHELPSLAGALFQATASPQISERFNNTINVLRTNSVAPGKEEKVAMALVSGKIKKWIKNQLETKVRDRVHALFVFSKLMRGVDRDAAEQEWKSVEKDRRREYLFGDEDSKHYVLFGFWRHWPGGKESRYESVYSAMRQFLINKARVERRNSQLDQWNAAVKQKNAVLPPEQHIPEREPIDLSMDIGKVTLTKQGDLVYTGKYPTLQEMGKTNEAVANLPLRERIMGDVRYAGPKGKVGRGERLYSDANLDVLVPLTLAAAVRAGQKEWEISNPEQLSKATADGRQGLTAWSQYQSGLDAYDFAGNAGAEDFKRIPIIFQIKAGPPTKMLATTSMDDLVELRPPYMGVKFRVGAEGREFTWLEIVKHWRETLELQVFQGLARSFSQAFRVIREWGEEFNPSNIVADPAAYHKARMGQRRGLREQIEERAAQCVNLLLR